MRVVHAADPVAHARALARQLGGDAVADVDELAAVVATRRGEGGDDGLRQLAALADDLARAARIRERTEIAFGEALAQRMTSPGALAIHPSSIENAARSVRDATAEVEAADDAIAALGPAPVPDAPEAGAEGRPEDGPGRATADLPSIRTRAAAAFFVVVGGGLVLTGTGVLPYVTLVAFALLGVGVAVLLLRLRVVRERDLVELAERRVASESLAVASAAADRSGQAVELARIELQAWQGRHDSLTQTRREASDRLRQARRNWESLAGPGADPDDVDAVLRAHDPQRSLAGVTAEASPTIRAVAALHRRALARWRVAWAALGYETAPDIARADEALDELRRARGRRPVVVADPQRWVEADRLAAALARLPDGVEVVVVRPEAAAAGPS
jgi:hypothetical protein